MSAGVVVWLELPVVVPISEDGKVEETKMKLLPQQVVAYHPHGKLLSIYLSSGLMFYIAMTMEEYEAAIDHYYKQVGSYMAGIKNKEALKNNIKIVR